MGNKYFINVLKSNCEREEVSNFLKRFLGAENGTIDMVEGVCMQMPEEELNKFKEELEIIIKSIDDRCISTHFYFKCYNCPELEETDGYIEIELKEATVVDNLVTIDGFNQCSETAKLIVSREYNIDLEDITQVTRDEYFKAYTC